MRSSIIIGLVLTWVGVAGLAGSPWMKWEYKPGEEGTTLRSWPAGSTITHTGTQVLMFVHPKCACTKSSLRILEQLATNQPQTRWLVVAWRPAGSDWKPETKLPFFLDEGGIETRRFGAKTSGHVLLFAPDGAVQYSGGLTDLRGGNEAGKGTRMLKAALEAAPAGFKPQPVLGCSL